MQKTFNKDFDSVFNNSIATLKELDFTVNSKSKTNGTILASSQVSFLSWGEEVTVKVKKTDANITKVIVSSKSNQLVTWGKNEKNENTIIELLSKKLAK